MRSDTTSNILYFTAGLCLGAAAGILLAPGPGAETRRYLASRADATRDYLEYGRELYEKGRELADEAAQMYEQGRSLVEG